jgi:hypothetical protein
LEEDEEVGDDEWENYSARNYKSVSKGNFNYWVDNSEFLKKYSNILENTPTTTTLKNNQSFLIGQLKWSNDWSSSQYKIFYKP